MTGATMRCVLAALWLAAVVAMAHGANTYSNPVVPELDNPDPGVLLHEGTYYATTTSQSAKNAYPIWVSTDLGTWERKGYIFPDGTHPKWATTDFWAPEIHHINGKFIAYFAARDTAGVLCVGAAHADHVLGPYTDIGKPLIRNQTMGNIDPTAFFNDQDQHWYLIWKEDGNGASPPEKYTPIWAQQLADDGLSVVGDRIYLIHNDLPWEGNLVEAPWMIKYNDTYYLFYSCNAFYNANYAVGIARSKSPLGPFEKQPTPVLHSDATWAGPGHCSVTPTPKRDGFAMVYHAWREPKVGGPGNPRLLMMDAVLWENGWPLIKGDHPSEGPQPLPQ